jgi:hypothetical protein
MNKKEQEAIRSVIEDLEDVCSLMSNRQTEEMAHELVHDIRKELELLLPV